MELDVIDTQSREISTLAAQSLVIAAGRFPELIFVENKPAEFEAEEAADQPLRWEAFAPYKRPAFKDEVGLFAEGDVLADYSAAIKAIGAGMNQAEMLARFAREGDFDVFMVAVVVPLIALVVLITLATWFGAF